MTWSPIPEMMWRNDPEVEAARKMPGWGKFHRECGKEFLYFDHIERHGGKRGEYLAVAFTLVGRDRRTPEKVAEGRAKTVLGAVEAAFRAAGRHIPAAEPWLALLTNPVAAATPDPEQEPADALLDFEDLLG